MGEFNSVVTSSPADQFQSNTVPSTPVNNPTSNATATTTQANELVVGGLMTATTLTFTAGTGFTLVGGSSANRASLEYKAVSSTGAQTATWSLSGTDDYSAAVQTFKATSGSAALVTGNGSCVDQVSASSFAQTFTNPQTAGNLNVVVFRLGNTTSTASIADTEGNSYTTIVNNVNLGAGTESMYMWYAANIKGDGTVAATMPVAIR